MLRLGGVMRLLVRMGRRGSSAAMMTAAGVVSVSMAVVVIVGGGRGHVVPAVGQMRRVLHTHLMAVMVGHMTLRRLHQRGLDVGHKLGHLDETFDCGFLLFILFFRGLGNTCFTFHCSARGLDGGPLYVSQKREWAARNTHTHTLALTFSQGLVDAMERRNGGDGGSKLGAWTTFSQEQCQMTDWQAA